MQINKQDFLSYVEGWLSTSESFEDLSMNNMGAALQNAFTMLKDDQDGIISAIERRKSQIG